MSKREFPTDDNTLDLLLKSMDIGDRTFTLSDLLENMNRGHKDKYQAPDVIIALVSEIKKLRQCDHPKLNFSMCADISCINFIGNYNDR